MTTYTSIPRLYPLTGQALTNADLQQACQWIHDAITSCGIVDTNDTGATDLSTITVGTVNTDRGWRMYRFNDTDQGSHPIYFRIDYGMGAVNTRWRLRIAIGQGTDGAGTLTGNTSGIVTVGGSGANTSQISTRNDFSCHTDGFFGMCIQPNDPSSVNTRFPYQTICIERARTLIDGAFDHNFVVMWTCGPDQTSSGEITVVDMAGNGNGYDSDYSVCLPVGDPADTANENGDKQLYPLWWADWNVRPMWSAFGFRYPEISTVPQTFQASPFQNAGQHTFIQFGVWTPRVVDTNWRLAFLWE